MTGKVVRPKGKKYPSGGVGGVPLTSAETQFYSNGAQYLDPQHQNASVQF